MTLDIFDMIAAAPRVFMSITIPDVIDIILLTLLLIAVIRFMSETRATQLLKGIGLIALLYLLVWLGQLKVMTYLFQNFFLQWGLVAIVVVFQPEIRRLLEKVGTTAKVRIPFLAYFEKADAQKVIERDTAITAISDACERLSRTKTGALIVIERQTKLQNIIEKSTIVDAKPSPELFCNLFFNKSPLHDGAIIIRNNRIYAAGCFLPLPEQQGREYIDPELGSRHRAAIGMSENSDAVVIIVSEETGVVSVAKSGQIIRSINEYNPKEWLLKILRDEMPLPAPSKSKGRKKKQSDSNESEVEE